LGSLIKVRIKEDALVARIAAFNLGASSKGAAIVFGKTIYLYKVTRVELLENTPYLRHELMHVLQYQREGFFGFLFKYLWYSLRFGYRQNPFEIEARESQTDKEILKRFSIV
jgi:hypothetical protein